MSPLAYTNYTDIVFSIPVSQVLGAILLALLIGAISGVYPAIKASKYSQQKQLENEKYNFNFYISFRHSLHNWGRGSFRRCSNYRKYNTIEVVEVEKTFEEGVLDFAQCMREQGINFPDPSFDIDGNPEFDDLNIENEEEFEEAFVNCEDILREALPEQFDLDPEVEAALVDASLEFSQCMRDEGIDFPDPKPGEFGFFAFRDADIDFESEDVQKAFEICQPENPLENLDD